MNNRNTIRPHLTEEQVTKFRDQLKGHHLEALITLALLTGMRRDELLSLKWQDVDLEKGDLRVQNAKTRNGNRVVHIPEDGVTLLKEHRQHQMEDQAKAGLTWANLDLVFPDRTGEFLPPHQLVQGFHKVLEQAELPRMSFHDLRIDVGKTQY